MLVAFVPGEVKNYQTYENTTNTNTGNAIILLNTSILHRRPQKTFKM